MISHLININTLAELKLMPGNNNNVVLLLGITTIGTDGMAALYYWDANSTDAEDLVYYNIISVTDVVTGRWRKLITKVTLVIVANALYSYILSSGGKKEVFIPNILVGSDGTATVNLTLDGTATGTPIFKTILFDDSKATVNTATANDAVSSCRKALSADLRTLTHLFFRGNSTSVTLLNVNVLGIRTAAQGTAVTFKVEGI